MTQFVICTGTETDSRSEPSLETSVGLTRCRSETRTIEQLQTREDVASAVLGMSSESMRMSGQSDARFITVLVDANSPSTSCSSCDGHRRALIKAPVMEHSKDSRSCWFGEQGRRKGLRFIIILIKVCFPTFESFGFSVDDTLAVS